MSNVKLSHPEDPDFVISRDEERDAPTFRASGWRDTNKAVTKSPDDDAPGKNK
jgi:hypothetical protein